MKAIQIKYLPATNTKGSRLKAMATDCRGMIVGFDYSKNDGGCNELARLYIVKQGWNCEISGTGTLANGDFVVTLAA